MPIVAIILGVYIIALVVQGNAQSAINEMLKSTGFLKWLLALGILMYLAKRPEIGKVASPFLVMALIGFLLYNLPAIKSQLSQAWAKL